MLPDQDRSAVRARLRLTSPEHVSLALIGELDVATAHTIAPVAELLANLDISAVALDLSPLTFVDLAGGRALERLQTRLRGASIDVTVEAVPPVLRSANGPIDWNDRSTVDVELPSGLAHHGVRRRR